jgi:hypothetical protein
MNSRTQHREGRGAGWGTPLAALWAVLGVLLASLAVCPGHPDRADAGPTRPAAPAITASATRAPADGDATDHRAVAVEHPPNCPSGSPGSARSEHAAVHAVRTTLPGTVQALSALLPRLARLPAPDGRPCPAGFPSARGAPDLHVLQVQRT